VSQETYLGSVSSTLRHTEDAPVAFTFMPHELPINGEYPA